jgi:hypothetical protein
VIMALLLHLGWQFRQQNPATNFPLID